MSKPEARLGEPAMPAWLGRMPVSSTATTTLGLPVVRSQAVGRLMPPGDSSAPAPFSK